MRIRKRPSREAGTGSSPYLEEVKSEHKSRPMNNGLKTTKQVGAAAVKQQQKQADATRYGGAAHSIRKRKMKQEQGLMALASWAAVMSRREEEYNNSKKKKKECPIGCVSEQRRQAEEQIIGEQPRTPPALAGEKPVEHGKKACSCGKKWGLRQEDMDPSLLGNKPNKNKNHHQQDTADSMARPSHENCGLEHSDEEEDQPSGGVGGLRRGDGDEAEEVRRDMGPLLKAVHAVISEAGMQGLTARETSELIRSRRLLSDGDIPRTVKIAKAMRDSPYLLELGSRGDCNARFVMWSTYLQTTSGKGSTRAEVSVRTALVTSTSTAGERDGVAGGGSQAGRRGRRSQPQQGRRRRGHGQCIGTSHPHQPQQQQQGQHETNPSSMVADDLLARVLMQVQKTLKTQARIANNQQAAQAVVDNNKLKPSHGHGFEQEEPRQCGQPQRQQQQQRVFLIDINSLPPPASMEINVTIERKQHILAEGLATSCKPFQQQQQQVARPLLIDLNVAPDDSCC